MPNVGIAVCIAVVGSAANNIGKVLQKQAMSQLPHLTLERKVLLTYAFSKHWRIGLLADVGGAAATLFALSLAPISLIQPVGGCGIAVLAVFSHYYLKEELQRTERIGVGVAVLGTVGVGATAVPGEDTMPLLFAGSALLLFMVAVFSGLERMLQRLSAERLHASPQKPPRLQKLLEARGLADVVRLSDFVDGDVGARQLEAIAGVQAGLLFGLSAASARTGMLLATLLTTEDSSWPLLFGPLGVAGSVTLSSFGIFCQNRGMKEGRAMVVCTYAAISTIVVGTAVGLFALNEGLPTAGLLGWLVSLALILVGVGLLVRRAPGNPAGVRMAKEDKEVV